MGDPNADFKFGVTNTLSYKGFQLNVLWDWTQGGDFYSETINSMLGRGVTRDTEDREISRVIDRYLRKPYTCYRVLMAETIILLCWLVVNQYQTKQGLQPMTCFSRRYRSKLCYQRSI